MFPSSNASRPFWLTILILTFIANGMAAWLSYVRWHELGVDLFRSVWGVLALVYLGMLVVCVFLFVLLIRSDEPSFWVSSFINVNLESPMRRILGGLFFFCSFDSDPLHQVYIPYRSG